MAKEITCQFKEYKKKKDINIRNQLVIKYKHIARSIATIINKNTPSHVYFEDIFSYGILGLIEAIEKFNPWRNIKFKTYAFPVIKGRILDNLRENDHISRTDRKRITQYENFINKTNRNPTKDEIFKELNLSELTYKHFIHALLYHKIINIGTDFYGSDEVEQQQVINLIKDYRFNPEHIVEEKSFREELYTAIKKLTKKEQVVIYTTVLDKLKLSDINNSIKVTTSRASQLRKQALRKLHTIFKDRGMEVYLEK